MSNSHSLKQSHRLPQRPSTELQVSLSALRSQPSTLSTLAERFSKWGCFLLYRLGKSSNNQLRKTKAQPESLTMCKSFQLRRFAVFQVCLQNNQRQKQQKQKCVKSWKVLLIVRAAAKLCCRRRSLYSTKTRNQGRVVFPSEISTLPLTPHFCYEIPSIMLRA